MRIMIDLDVITIAEWNKEDSRKQTAEEFHRRVKSGEFEVYTPYLLFELIRKWKNKKLVDKILNFYSLYSTEIITIEKLAKKLQETGISLEILSKELTRIIKKEDDSDLVLISSVFELDYLVTFNRKHLRNKKEQIIQFLKRKNLKSIKVVLPNEI